MKTYHLGLDGQGDTKLESLPLPFIFNGTTATDRDRERAPGPEIAQKYAALRLLKRQAGFVENTAARAYPRLLIIASGSVELTTAYMVAELSPGDVMYLDDLNGGTGVLTYGEDTRIIEIEVSTDWKPEGVVPPVIKDAGVANKVVEMHVADEKAHFRDASGLFDLQETDDSAESILAVSFLAFSPDLVSDWHTEAAVSIVVALSGGFELQVGGQGGEEVLRAGDVCLVDDRTGQGHITRIHGETRVVAIRIPNEHRWR
ncbi:hypothetical protein FFI94_032020 [Rhodococcus sp. KBS0724]|uniref:hypothetical protein n=1 Tax=Rhodococcus sp. KBS0724 TaxID=1179674 RepID=UPI00110EAC5F|nr:hypothetical protein [Rhodococcus sp. KBS0724]TSD40359.1 hypothetical protein FFI94_032020 [Rhodococcus sp. KBS0724]